MTHGDLTYVNAPYCSSPHQDADPRLAYALSIVGHREKRYALQKGGIAKGTVIATFVNGRYQNLRQGNHAALFIRQVPGGIEFRAVAQPHARVIYFGRSAAGASNRPELYSVVE